MSIIRKAIGSKGLKQSGVVVVGNLTSTTISAISLILISRYLGPDQFGLFSVAFSLYMFITRLCDVGINMAVQKYVAQTFENQSNQARSYIWIAFHIKAVTSLGIILLGWFGSAWLATHVFHMDQINLIRWAIMLSVVSFWYDYLLVIFQSLHQFNQAILLPFIQSSSKLILIAVFYYLGNKNVTALFGWYAAVPIASLLVGYIILPNWIKAPIRASKSVQQKLFSMAKFTSIAILAAAVGDHIDVLMIKHYLTEYQTGLFAAASRISLMMAVAGYFMGTVLNSRVARYTDKHHLIQFIIKAIGLIVFILVGSLAILPFSEFLLRFTAGPEYISATNSLKLLIYSGSLVLATAPLVALFYALDRPQYFAISGIIQTLSLIALNYWLIPQYGILGSGMARLITRIVIFILTIFFAYYVVKQKYGYRLLDYYTHSLHWFKDPKSNHE